MTQVKPNPTKKLSNAYLALACVALLVIQGCTAVAGVVIVGGANMVNDKRSFGKQIDDQGIDIIAQQRLYENAAFSDDSNITAISINGSVLMIGQTSTAALRNLAVKTVENVKGVLQVHDQIRLGHVTSFTTQTSDTWLTTKIKTKLLSAEALSTSNIKVITENKEVFLMGIVTKKDADIAVEITRNIEGVSRVFNVFEYL